jgi:hypothetical protein
MLAALKTADGAAVGIANHAVALLKAPVYVPYLAIKHASCYHV